jgi:hypothetical protein
MIAAIWKLLDLIAAIPKIYEIIMTISAAVASWYIARQNKISVSGIADAIALASKAKSKEERYEALDKLYTALSANRYS